MLRAVSIDAMMLQPSSGVSGFGSNPFARISFIRAPSWIDEHSNEHSSGPSRKETTSSWSTATILSTTSPLRLSIASGKFVSYC